VPPKGLRTREAPAKTWGCQQVSAENRPGDGRVDSRTEREHSSMEQRGNSDMTAYIKDLAALIVVVSFIASIGVVHEAMQLLI
jgi:hypothetical protein